MTGVRETLQRTDFDGLVVASTARTLRPRQWTAAQARWASELLTTAPPGDVLELCAGVGHIGMRAVRAHAGRRLVCADVSAEACRLAGANAERNGLADRVEVRCGRLGECVAVDERFALVLADPPYLPTADVARYPDDPPLAVDGGSDGLDVARECLAVAAGCLAPGGRLLLQLRDAAQARRLARDEEAALLELEEVRDHGRGVVALLVRHDLTRAT